MQFVSDSSLPDLLCQEDESCVDEFHYKDLNFEACSVSEADDEYIRILIQREVSFRSDCPDKRTDNSWLNCTRLDAIKWILNTGNFFGFQFRTVYLSLIYFHRFFSRRSIEDGKLWAIRLLSVACLSLAAKMEECKVPALSEYQVDEYCFDGSAIQRMELLVLNTLEWKMNSVTPFAYIHYFIAKFCDDAKHKEVVTRATELILAIVKEINVVEHRPSIIAAAAVLAAYDYQLTKKLVELKMNAIPSWGSLEKEHIFSCYNLLQGIGMVKYSTPPPLIPPNCLSNHSSSFDVVEKPLINTNVGSKRRLTYSDSDQNCPPEKFRRL